MSYPHDRAAQEPGGMECCECGVIFVGSAAHDQCAVCANSGWLPIDTAPKDGTVVLAFERNHSPDYYPCWFKQYMYEGAFWQNDYDSDPQPTHWQPLPKPPIHTHGDAS